MTSRLGGAIAQCDPRAEYLAFREEIDAAVRAVFEGGSYILGGEVASFEKDFAGYLGVRDCVGVANGTDAIVLALRALGIGRGDAVITVSMTAVATVAAIELAGAVPVLVDVEPRTMTMDPRALNAVLRERAAIEERIGARLKAVVAVHLYGRSAAIEEIVEVATREGLSVVEDCAQAHGAKLKGKSLGRFGRLGTFSFYPTKNLGAIGDGGAVVTDDAVLAEWIRQDRQYGWRERYVSEWPGMNSRLDAVQAAILRVKLRHLDECNARRRAIAEAYDSLLARTSLILPMAGNPGENVYHQYVVRHRGRDAMRRYLEESRIRTLVHYPRAVHQQPAYAGRLVCVPEGLPETELATAEIVSLPMHARLDLDAAQTAAEAVRAWVERAENGNKPKTDAGRARRSSGRRSE